MSKLIFVPQYPVKLRYSDWWLSEFQKQFRNHFKEVIVLGSINVKRESANKEMFSPIEAAIKYELQQIEQYMKLNISKDDILFLSDISFPGFFTNVLYHKRPDKCFAFCHATSLNAFDYFSPVRYSKFPVETAHANLFNKIFVGSYYHKEKIGWDKTAVVRVPKPPFDFFDSFRNPTKEMNIVSASRPTLQKVNIELEKSIEKDYGEIRRPPSNIIAWIQYYSFLSRSKVLLITSKEDTFNYTIIDAVLSNCIPVAPFSLCFPELLPREYLYENEEELRKILDKALSGNLPVPKLLCQEEVDNFYSRIISEMKGE